MAELLISYAAEEILQVVQSVVTDTVTRAWGLENDLEKLSESTGRLQSLLQKAQNVLAVEDDESIKLWLKKLQQVVYAAADVLDEFQFEILRRKVEVNDQLKRKVRDFVSGNNPILFRVKMAAKVKEVGESLADMEKQAPLVLLTMTIPTKAVAAADRGVALDSHPDRRTDSFLGERTIGRTEEAERIIKTLQVSSTDVPLFSVISIVGFGGLGKITLAQLVFEEAEKKGLFDEIMWVCVSEPFDIQKILGEMLQKLDKTTGGLSSIDVIVGNLRQQLKDKRFLLVLDDVWNEETEKWENLKRRLGNICGKSGNFVLTTTRSSEVANIMESKHVEELKQLSDTECWSIIKEMVVGNGGESIIPHDMETIGMEIANKCGGVSLAAKIVGGVLRSSKKKAEWLSVRRSNVWNEVDKDKRISGVLKLSFHHLPPPQKLCFVYCSLFPKDFVFEKARLIQLWMAEDFLKTNGGTNAKSMEDVGEEYFYSLLVHSFFQDAQLDDCGNIIRCKMHDLLHDLASSICKSQRLQCGTDCIETSDGRRLNFSCDQESKVHEMLESSKDQTLNLRSLFCSVDVTPMLSNFRRLRSLDMSDAKLKDLPCAIRKLKHLRHLDISNNENIQVLPESITKLYNLQTLRVFKCKSLKELPCKIINLVSLRHIGFDDKRLMPVKVGCLSNLQTLPIFVVGLEDGQSINELAGLNELRGELVVCDLENVRDKGEAESAKMKEKKLSKLVLKWMDLWMELEENGVESFSSSRQGNHEQVMEGLEAPTNIQSLTVEWYMGKQFPRWISELSELVNLTLKSCKRCVTMPTLGHLPHLKVLSVERMDSIKSIGSEFYGETKNVKTQFPLLESFSIREMKSLVELLSPKGTEIFPKLQYLDITDCPDLTSFPWGQSLSSAIYMRLHSSSKDEASVAILCNFKSLQRLSIGGCPKLTFLHIGLTSTLRFHVKPGYYYSQQQDKLVKNLSVCSNKLDGFWILMNMQYESVDEMIREFPKSLEVLKIKMFNYKLSEEAFHELSRLKLLVIKLCDFQEIPSLSSLTSLEHLKITSSAHLNSIPALSSLSCLKELHISVCDSLSSVPDGFKSCQSLEKLVIKWCDNVKSLPSEIKLCRSLKVFEVSRCREMASIDDDIIGCLTQLKELEWGGFSEELDQVPALSSIHLLTSLQKLKIIGWNKLTSIPLQLQDLTSITHLEIGFFDVVESLPDWFCNFSSLESLSIYSCKSLKNLPKDMKRLCKLTSLCIWYCPLLKERCAKDVGPQWSNISHIPRISFL